MKTKLLALLLVMIMALGMLAACGGGGNDACTKHVDANYDGKCDNEGCDASVPCTKHVDADKNGKCDRAYCNATVTIKCDNHVDEDDDFKCDNCNQRIDIWEDLAVEWENTELIFWLTENSNGEELPSTCKRYMAGEDTSANENIDIEVSRRNEAAYAVTNVTIDYQYWPDTDTYKWGSCVEDIIQKNMNGGSQTPDMYCNFIYDMVAASLKSCFANLYSTSYADGTNYFQFSKNPENFHDTGDGYMVEYMKSLSLSKFKMYCLASDYFTDMVRAFFVVPVSATLMSSISPDLSTDDAFNSDRTGDGKFDIDDFYQLVKDGDWNYKTLADFATAVLAQGKEGNTNDDELNDTLGFAITTGGLPASGMLYTTSITIINREWSDVYNDYAYWYPDPLDTENGGAEDIQDLVDLCNNMNDLFNSRGIIAVSSDSNFVSDYSNGQSKPLIAIRTRFADNKVLFGGVICLGSLEYDAYQDMEGGFGVAPAPLYREINPETNEPDNYLTQIHNVGRVGAIGQSTTKFAQCTAFLDYLSTHSTDILNEYYDYKLKYDIAGDVSGSNGNAYMLQYIRENVRSSFDKAYEDAIGYYFSENDKNATYDRWHMMIAQANYQLTDMANRYKEVYGLKSTRLQSLWDGYDNLPN